jgi:tryptophan synthase alpha subunit
MPIRFDRKPGLIVYLTVGDPSLDATRAIALAAIDAGAAVIELGVPFSDPLADGPVIQRAMERAVARGVRLADVLQMAREIRAERPAAGLVIFSYLNPILRYGLKRFADDAAAAGVDGVLATDMIVEEANWLAPVSRPFVWPRPPVPTTGLRLLLPTPKVSSTPSRAPASPARSKPSPRMPRHWLPA